MAQNLMVWLMERRVVLEARAEQLRKQLADTEAEVTRLGAAEVVYRQYQEDADAGHCGCRLIIRPAQATCWYS
jgi:hypothetical protein